MSADLIAEARAFGYNGSQLIGRLVAALEAAETVTGDTSDGYHTFNELYEFRKLYNAALFNEWAKNNTYPVHKSWKHSDGENCFGGGWFIVMAQLPNGQISNHYEAADWDLFQIPERVTANLWDGHTAADVAERLRQAIRPDNTTVPATEPIREGKS